MKIIIVYAVLIIFTLNVLAQGDFQTSGSCQRRNNVNCGSKHQNNIRTTFKFIRKRINDVGSKCTGTLINRDVSQGELGTYFISARHCHDNGDFSKEWEFYFNYQSPDCNDESILEFKNLFI